MHHFRYLDGNGSGIIDGARQWQFNGVTYPSTALRRKPGEDDAAHAARLNSIGVQPVRYAESPHNPLTERRGAPVGAEVAGWWEISFPVPQPIPVETLRATKSQQIVTMADSVMATLTSTYSEHEKLSWPKQEIEAKALAADETADAPLLAGIAAARGIGLLELRDKVLSNVTEYEAASSAILGQQQRFEDLLEAAGDDAAAITAIDVAYTLPGA